MRMKFTELALGSCFTLGKSKKEKKKISEREWLIVKDNGKVNRRKMKGDPEVDYAHCPLRYLGVGLPRVPDQLIEIGDGNILDRKEPRR